MKRMLSKDVLSVEIQKEKSKITISRNVMILYDARYEDIVASCIQISHYLFKISISG